jgi:uncharacterized protein YecT (DUF1311 family)
VIAWHSHSWLCARRTWAPASAFALTVLAFAPIPARAQTNSAPAPLPEPALSKAYQDCVQGTYPDSGPALACLEEERHRHDAHLNKLYRQRIAQLGNDETSIAMLREVERNWIHTRNSKCAASARATPNWNMNEAKRCLIVETDARADYFEGVIHDLSIVGSPGDDYESNGVPPELWGKWTVSKILRTSTISCWSEKDADVVLGTTIEYAEDRFAWQDHVTYSPHTTTSAVTSQQFADDNSGGGASGSSVSFQQLGIMAPRTIKITVGHPGAEITGATTEIPGDTVLVVDAHHIVFSLCNLYFLAVK